MTEPAKIRVLVVDDHQVVRMGMNALVATTEGIEVVGEATDGREAIELYQDLLPDVVLMDSRMPGMGGPQATAEILQRWPDAQILMLSAYDGDFDIRQAMEAGVLGYVLKASTSDNLIPALRTVAAGEKWIPKEVSDRLVSQGSIERLTSREIQVLSKLAKGMANKQIADELRISEYTVKDHVKNILAKLRVRDRTEAVSTALKRGIIHL
jgi:DNA-binding NarL/FixJ family response regulator